MGVHENFESDWKIKPVRLFGKEIHQDQITRQIFTVVILSMVNIRHQQDLFMADKTTWIMWHDDAIVLNERSDAYNVPEMIKLALDTVTEFSNAYS